MAAFTTFSRAALERYLVMFDAGELESFEPIKAGIENSNYFVTLEQNGGQSEYVLTITENLTFEDVPFFNDVFHQLDRSGLPVPNPVKTMDGMASTIFCGKPTWLFPRLPGSHPSAVTDHHCKVIGEALARLHESARACRYVRTNPYDRQFLAHSHGAHRHRMSAEDALMCDDILTEYGRFADVADLPGGIIHGDLFRDNALFEGDALTGIIDFYHACDDFLAQDLAITINDWATDPDGSSVEARESALIAGYEKVRALTAGEYAALPVLRRVAALRFVLTRLLSGGDGETLKDPEEFLRIARALNQ